ncbi:actin-related protein centractin-like protein [Thalassiosira pseudonana CCMP1335]|uniref:Actin-related protein centractin-like protein n=1 Tax=Thalassiosira pseudonana TaxID=35128 RepID=B8C9E2_THAPS|nr:actin-related protein centractin-like protein [Thalassiosira pseudonana CCMP1335]EED90032.1 actin-related protein centractin-like protein [Thalassiosira pseudonana CCMP1335]
MLNQPIVIDCGSASMKAGFAGGTKPKVRLVWVPFLSHLSPFANLCVTSYFVGRKLDEHRGAFLLEYPMERGSVVDGGWDAMELLWEHIYSKNNLNAKMDEHPVLLTESPHNPSSHREQLAEVFFETFRAPALFVAPPAVLSLYASGRTTGVVLDVGEGVTHCIPVYEGYALPHSIVRSDLAGRDVTKRLQLLLRKSGLAFSTTAEADFVSTMKEEVCYVSNRPTKDVTSNANVAKAQYQLPDGEVIDISNERHRSSEVLFQPQLIGSEAKPIHDVLMSSILQSDMDLRSTLFSNIVLSGGSTLLPGLGDRLLYEVRARAPERTRIRISAPPERMHSAWCGGSILASLATFKNMWVGKSEYEEYGSNILHRGSL